MATQRAVFVFGGTGKVGRALVRSLEPHVAQGALDLRLGVRSPQRAQELLPGSGARFVPFDLDAPPENPASVLRGCHAMFLLTGYTVDMLIQSTIALDAAVAAGVRHVVHLGVHLDEATTNAHLAWHLYVEKLIESSGLAWTHLRPNWMMQNVLKTLAVGPGGLTMRNGLSPDRVVSWIDAEDVGAAAAAVLADPRSHRGQTYPLAAEARSLGEVCELIGDVLGRPCRYLHLDAVAFRAAKLKSEADVYHASAIHYYEQVEAGQTPECDGVFDLTPLLGRQPTSWRAFVARQPEAFGPAPR